MKMLITVLYFFSIIVLSGTGKVYARSLDEPVGNGNPENGTLAASAKLTPGMPTASGVDVRMNEKTIIDVSNAKDGYIMIKYQLQTANEVRVIIKGPSGTQYIYTLKTNGDYEVFPLSDGNGAYNIGVYENTAGNKYATAYTAKLDVAIKNEYAPFLLPNQFVNYRADSETAKKAAALTKGVNSTTERIAAVYNYVIKNISYDTNLASAVRDGKVSLYISDTDAVLKSGKGICIDYAAVMSVMLRSQGIPTKFVLGYVKDVYHAWISTYSVEEGWVNNVIFFDGKGWKLMDPTFASTDNQSDEAMKFISDEKNYAAKNYY